MKHVKHGGIGMGLTSMFRALMKGKSKHGSSWLPSRRARHRISQMNAISKGKFTGRNARFGL